MSAEVIAKRNVSKRVNRVLAAFDESARHLKVVYVVDTEPSEDDRDDCELTCAELTCAELIAEFPEIRTAETSCVSVTERSAGEDDHETIVFKRA